MKFLVFYGLNIRIWFLSYTSLLYNKPLQVLHLCSCSLSSKFYIEQNPSKTGFFEGTVKHFSYPIQGYPQRMRLQRRLYRIYTVCFRLFTIPFNCKLVSNFAKSLNKPLQDYR